MVLERLRADGLEDDTVIIFFADNGRLEARGIHWCYDSGLHVPLIIRWPKHFPPPPQYRAGTVNDQVISLLDLTATTLAIAGVPRPPGMQSRIFLGAEADPPRQYAFSARDRIDETVQRIRSVRDARYRYIRNFMPERPFMALNRYKEKCFLVLPLMRELHDRGALTGPPLALFAPRLPDEELYDTQADPHEIQNLADSGQPEHRDALVRLRAALDVWLTETGDLGASPEPPGILAPIEQEMHDWFGTPAGTGAELAALRRDRPWDRPLGSRQAPRSSSGRRTWPGAGGFGPATKTCLRRSRCERRVEAARQRGQPLDHIGVLGRHVVGLADVPAQVVEDRLGPEAMVPLHQLRDVLVPQADRRRLGIGGDAAGTTSTRRSARPEAEDRSSNRTAARSRSAVFDTAEQVAEVLAGIGPIAGQFHSGQCARGSGRGRASTPLWR